MDLFYIPLEKTFSLYISTKPNGGGKLENEIKYLKTLGHSVVLCSLLSNNEISKHQLHNEPLISNLQEIDFIKLEIPDESIPGYNDFRNLIKNLLNKTKTKDVIIVHCKYGIGRSGMVAVAILLNFGYDLKPACDLVSKARGYNVPQSKSQFKLLQYYLKNEINK